MLSSDSDAVTIVRVSALAPTDDEGRGSYEAVLNQTTAFLGEVGSAKDV